MFLFLLLAPLSPSSQVALHRLTPRACQKEQRGVGGEAGIGLSSMQARCGMSVAVSVWAWNYGRVVREVGGHPGWNMRTHRF